MRRHRRGSGWNPTRDELVARRGGAGLVRAPLALLLIALRLTNASVSAQRAGLVALGVGLVQGLIGDAQYFTDLPVVAVALHMLGACLLVIAGGLLCSPCASAPPPPTGPVGRAVDKAHPQRARSPTRRTAATTSSGEGRPSPPSRHQRPRPWPGPEPAGLHRNMAPSTTRRGPIDQPGVGDDDGQLGHVIADEKTSPAGRPRRRWRRPAKEYIRQLGAAG